MPFTGSLEDLTIRDLLQLLSLSKKSGALKLWSELGEGQICFLDGQVVRASSTCFPEGVGQLLRARGVVSETQIEQALEYQKSLPEHCPLGKILIELFKISPTLVETVVVEQIEKIVFSFFSWKQGSFSFSLEELDRFGSAQVNPIDFMLEQGLSPQRLALKGERIYAAGKQPIDEIAIEQELARQKKRHQQQRIDLLKGMLAELEHPEYGGGIILLILRYASEIMGRAIVFDVRGGQLVGVGQFGLEGLGDAADQIVRKLQLKIEPDSLFFEVLNQQAPIRGPLGETDAERYLQSFLGGSQRQVFLAPLVSGGRVVALLYGDRFAAEKQDAMETFQVFLSQAGLAMEQALFDQ
jgi:hypothetical protein